MLMIMVILMARGKRKIITSKIIRVLDVPELPATGMVKRGYCDDTVLIGTWLPYKAGLDMLGQCGYPDGALVAVVQTTGRGDPKHYLVESGNLVPARYDPDHGKHHQGGWVKDYNGGKIIPGTALLKKHGHRQDADQLQLFNMTQEA